MTLEEAKAKYDEAVKEFDIACRSNRNEEINPAYYALDAAVKDLMLAAGLHFSVCPAYVVEAEIERLFGGVTP